MDQESIQIDLAVSQVPATLPRAFPMPFLQAIMDVVIPATFVGPKATFTSVEDLPHTDDANWRLRCNALQDAHEYTDMHNAGLVCQLP